MTKGGSLKFKIEVGLLCNNNNRIVGLRVIPTAEIKDLSQELSSTILENVQLHLDPSQNL